MSDVSPRKPRRPALEFRCEAGGSYALAAKYRTADIHLRSGWLLAPRGATFTALAAPSTDLC